MEVGVVFWLVWGFAGDCIVLGLSNLSIGSLSSWPDDSWTTNPHAHPPGSVGLGEQSWLGSRELGIEGFGMSS